MRVSNFLIKLEKNRLKKYFNKLTTRFHCTTAFLLFLLFFFFWQIFDFPFFIKQIWLKTKLKHLLIYIIYYANCLMYIQWFKCLTLVIEKKNGTWFPFFLSFRSNTLIPFIFNCIIFISSLFLFVVYVYSLSNNMLPLFLNINFLYSFDNPTADTSNPQSEFTFNIISIVFNRSEWNIFFLP